MSGTEKRKFTRIPFETEIRLSTDTQRISASRMRNISLGGMFVVTGETLPLDSICQVEIDLIGPASLLRIRLEADVVRVEPDGIAVKFTKMDMDSLVHLRHLITIHAGSPETIEEEYYRTLFGVEPPSDNS
ncbi:MAG: PilZ domain-containing protein [Desulfomonile sp.]|nr:PilZ domain-containing protein [Desulfomonile sp.]